MSDDLDLDELERVADAATQLTEWKLEHGKYCSEITSGSTLIVYNDGGEDNHSMTDDLVHIATFDPPTVKRLIVRVRELEKIKEEVEGMGRLLALHGARATAWKQVFERGLDCEGAATTGREREAARALAKALGKARDLEAGQP